MFMLIVWLMLVDGTAIELNDTKHPAGYQTVLECKQRQTEILRHALITMPVLFFHSECQSAGDNI